MQQVLDWGGAVPPDILTMVPLTLRGVAKRLQVAFAGTHAFLSRTDVEYLVLYVCVGSKVNSLDAQLLVE